ncbi:MAG: YcgN family cysteine cluster protein [Deltaproteobacteria bacterium]|nr:YcgN family cysteine cluster protein [Deltaproteobacteria bacterium]
MVAKQKTVSGDHAPFWERKTLGQMSPEEWEMLCDGCGRCCLQKLEDRKTGKVRYTWVSCYLFDTQRCRCTAYENRSRLVKGCTTLTPSRVKAYRWLPRTCAYRLLAGGKPLPPWHPLLTGDKDSVHAAGISVKGRAIPEVNVHPDDVEYYTIAEPF